MQIEVNSQLQYLQEKVGLCPLRRSEVDFFSASNQGLHGRNRRRKRRKYVYILL
jgi:hypothetical protein